MTRVARAAWILLCLTQQLSAQSATRDGGGKDVSVAMFSTRQLKAVTLTAANPADSNEAWVARCEKCAHEPLLSQLQIAAPGDWFAGGTIRVRDNDIGDERMAYGRWHVRASSVAVEVVLTLPSERYVAAVLAAEAAHDEPSESLRALAIVVRTYALNGVHYAAPSKHLSTDLCDSTQCMALRLGATSHAVEEATHATAGETLWFGNRRAEVYFSQNCGGNTEDGGSVWPSLSGARYLHAHADPFCTRHGILQWHAEITLADLQQIAHREDWNLPHEIGAARIDERTASYRAKRILFTSNEGKTTTLSATALRFGVGRALGWARLPSDSYNLTLHNNMLVFDGRGRGHGVGLCQTGAAEMAAEGKSSREILAFYFPGTKVSVDSLDAGWQKTKIGTLTIHSVQPITSERSRQIETAWADAQKRFLLHKPVAADLVFAPSTEIFRQLTGQPGWMLASTRANTVVIQPNTVFAFYDASPAATLLHEMLHVLMEYEATDKAPLWLREGLVEVLSGDTRHDTLVVPANDIEAGLRRPVSWQIAQMAHRAAAAKVQRLIERYGVSTVRVWLSKGVPPGPDSM